MSFHIYGAERTRRAQVFTGSAADAFFLVYDRQLRRIRVVRVFCHHQDRWVGQWRAQLPQVTPSRLTMQFLNQYGMSDLDGRFVCFRDWTDRSGRANFRTFDAFGTTVSSLVRYFWLHKCLKVPRGRSTWFVQTDTQSWHAVQCWEKLAALSEPEGDRGCSGPVSFYLR